MHWQFRTYIDTNLQIFHYYQVPSSTVVCMEVVNKFMYRYNTLYILMEKNYMSSNNNEISFLF